MKSQLVTTLAAFISVMVSATLIALAMRSSVAPMFGEHIRTDAEGLNFAALMSGYFIIAIALVWFVPRVQTGTAGWRHGLKVGAALGVAIFLGDHLVTAGWSRLPSLPMLISGVLDSLAVAIGGVVVATILREPQK